MTFCYLKKFLTELLLYFLKEFTQKIKFETDENCKKDVTQIVECFAEFLAENWIGKSTAEKTRCENIFKKKFTEKLKPLYNHSFPLLLGLRLRFCLRGKYSDIFNYFFLRNSYICFGQFRQQQQTESCIRCIKVYGNF